MADTDYEIAPVTLRRARQFHDLMDSLDAEADNVLALGIPTLLAEDKLEEAAAIVLRAADGRDLADAPGALVAQGVHAYRQTIGDAMVAIVDGCRP